MTTRLEPASWEGRFTSRLHTPRTAAFLGMALGLSFSVCFATGLVSHLAQQEPSWFTFPPRPAGLYRITQGVHVITGFASIPLLLAKLWTVAPRFVTWPPVRSVAHAVERAFLLPLVGGSIFLLVSGTANVARWYPWTFFFPKAHWWVAWITIGSLVVHIAAKWAQVGQEVRRPADGARREAVPERRWFLAGVAGTATTFALATAGGTVRFLGDVSALAQRRPDQGPRGLPVNKSARQAGVVDLIDPATYELQVLGAVQTPLRLSLADLQALPQHEAELPIACVEGWSASGRWTGVRVRDLLARAGAAEGAEVVVESIQPRGLYRRSVLNPRQATDGDTLLALLLDGDPLHPDHGAPVRLIGPNRPGVLQTKWVDQLVVR